LMGGGWSVERGVDVAAGGWWLVPIDVAGGGWFIERGVDMAGGPGSRFVDELARDGVVGGQMAVAVSELAGGSRRR